MRSPLMILLLVVVAAWAAAVIITYRHHHGDQPVKADAVVVLQGSKSRLPEGLKLVEEGYAPLLVISRGDHKDLESRLCAPGQAVLRARVICFEADPTSTRGEAEYIGRLAKKEKLSRIDVVTSKFHVFRAKMLIARCYHGSLHMVGSDQTAWKLPMYAVSETAKLAYQVTVARGC